MKREVSKIHRERNERSLKRKEGLRAPYTRILILCEGSKTEPEYFTDLCKELGIQKFVKIRRCKEGNDPVTIVKVGLTELDEGAFDEIFCVFDKEFSNYKNAVDEILVNNRKDKKIYSITSVPCFEYWILLHFKETSKPYHPTGKKTAGEKLKSELQKHIKDYHESMKGLFWETKHLMDEAIRRAKRMLEQNDSDNPSTKVHELIVRLKNLQFENTTPTD